MSPSRSRAWTPRRHLRDGAVVVAAITSCTNTSNPAVLVAAGLVARRAVELGLGVEALGQDVARARAAASSWTTSTGPGWSQPLEKLGFYLAGYGCTTCIGNSGPLLDGVSEAANEHDLSVVSVLSGNRNFEGRIHPDVKQNFLASPPLVVAYALAGTIDIDLTNQPLGTGANGEPVFLKDLWPTRRRGRRRGALVGHPRHVLERYGARLRRRRALGGDPRDVGGHLRLGRRARPTSSSRRTSTA